MKPRVTRRDVLKVIGGAAVGTLFTPLPWKLLDDLAIRTQNQGWVAHPRRGRVGIVPTHCSLCPAGCALRLRCIDDIPVGVSAIPAHPLQAGQACPYGLVLHHFAGHPARLREARIREGELLRPAPGWESSLESWLEGTLLRGGAAGVAILDPRPGRSVSRLYRCFLASLGSGHYLPLPSCDSPSMDASVSSGLPEGMELAYELSSCRTILGLDAPLLESWGTPGRILPLLRRGDMNASGEFARLIEASAAPSSTARLADQWLRIRPGSEPALMIGLARAMVDHGWYHDSPAVEGLRQGEYALFPLLERFPTTRIALATGLTVEEIEATAWRLSNEGPSLAVLSRVPGDPHPREELDRMILALNLLLGAGANGGALRMKRTLPIPVGLRELPAVPNSSLEDIPDGSLGLVLIDGARLDAPLPWAHLERKLDPEHGRLVAFTPYDSELARRCDLALPVHAPLEGWDEIHGARDLACARFAVTRPVFPAGFASIDPVGLLHRLSPDRALLAGRELDPSQRGLLRSQSDALYEDGKGHILPLGEAHSEPFRSTSAEALWKSLEAGDEWCDDSTAAPCRWSAPLFPAALARRLADSIQNPGLREPAHCGRDRLFLVPRGTRVSCSGEALPPVLAKLCRESDLLPREGVAYLHPDTARECGVRDGSRIRLAGSRGELEVLVLLNPMVAPSTVVVPMDMGDTAFGDETSLRRDRVVDLVSLESDPTRPAVVVQLRRDHEKSS